MKASAFAVAIGALVLTSASVVGAQAPRPEPDAPTIDATRMGVSLNRIQKGLRLAEATERRRANSPLRLDIQIQVFGTAPRIDVLKGVDLTTGQVPGSAPTHKDVIEFLTPQIYRAPVLPIYALMGWAAQQLYTHNKKTECEAEIANYRSLLMQGVNVAAPRCTQ